MLNISEEETRSVGQVLNDKSRPLKERFRALFTLRNIGGQVAIEEIKKCFADDSALLKHELAYCLGQMCDPLTIPILKDILNDKSQEPIVRHEAAEALSTLGDASVVPVLQEYSTDPITEIAETCKIALLKIKWVNDNSKNSAKLPENPFCSLDPAPPLENTNITELTNVLLDEQVSLFERYRAMFSLRNLQTKESVVSLAKGLKAGSALFRHEIAFVLGQLQEEISVPHLKETLEDLNENEMVRHECAEALGSIATPECFDILKKYLYDNKRVVRESCVIALDMCDYENSKEFQYANTLLEVR